MKAFVCFFFALLLTAPAFGQEHQPVPRKAVPELQFLSYFINQGIINNVYAQNELLRGQTVGRLFGGNTSTTGSERSTYFEQRLLPFFIYTPRLFNGKAILRASFEIDWTWGDVSYGTGGNFGSAFSADQVNIQTQNVELEFRLRPDITLNLGLQRLFDTPYNPYRTLFGTMSETGYRLAFWGSDAVGLSLHKYGDYSRWKAGFYQLYENNIEQNDDVMFFEAFHERDLSDNWRQGLSLWYLRDRANGEGGVSILGQGLASQVNDYNGSYRFPLRGTPYDGDILWAGTFWSYNPEFRVGRTMLTGFAITNTGKVRVESDSLSDISLLGYAANLRGGYRYGQTARDVVVADLLYSSGDDNGISDDQFSGVLTGNTWGSPGAIYISSGASLLLPHGNVVNRYIAAVSDLSNIGYGFTGGTLYWMKDWVPNKFYSRIGVAAGRSVATPSRGGNFMGTEGNLMLGFQPGVFMNLELHGAYLSLGDFYDSPVVNGGSETRPDNAWTAFVVFKWLMF